MLCKSTATNAMGLGPLGLDPMSHGPNGPWASSGPARWAWPIGSGPLGPLGPPGPLALAHWAWSIGPWDSPLGPAHRDRPIGPGPWAWPMGSAQGSGPMSPTQWARPMGPWPNGPGPRGQAQWARPNAQAFNHGQEVFPKTKSGKSKAVFVGVLK